MSKKIVNELTKVGDPVLRIELPEIVVRMLKESARKNKRRTQDQFIKSLAETFKHEDAFAQSADKFLPDLKEVYKF